MFLSSLVEKCQCLLGRKGGVGLINIRIIIIFQNFQQLELYSTFLFEKLVKNVFLPKSIVYSKPSQNADMSWLDNNNNIIILYILLFMNRKWKNPHQEKSFQSIRCHHMVSWCDAVRKWSDNAILVSETLEGGL